MKYPWHEMKNRIQNAVLLSAVAMFCSLPLFQYQYLHLYSTGFHASPSPEKIYYLAVSQSFILFAAALLSSLIGFLYSDPLMMPGFGKLSDAVIWLPVGFLIGIVCTPVRYFLFDRKIMMAIPELFPKPWDWALAQMIGATIPQEVIVRFGLFTIGVYLLRKLNYSGHPLPAIGMISAFGAFITYLTMVRFGIAAKLTPSQLMTLLIPAFFLQWIYCEIYIRKGLVITSCIHLGLTVKFLIYALVF